MRIRSVAHRGKGQLVLNPVEELVHDKGVAAGALVGQWPDDLCPVGAGPVRGGVGEVCALWENADIDTIFGSERTERVRLVGDQCARCGIDEQDRPPEGIPQNVPESASQRAFASAKSFCAASKGWTGLSGQRMGWRPSPRQGSAGMHDGRPS
jgi:hypothetical protein